MCEILRSNFEDLFPIIEDAIVSAEFLAIDTEFSGLSLSAEHCGSLFDDGKARYHKLRESISQFTVTQIGLSAFVRDRKAANTYVAHTFNCYLYPCAFGPYDMRFVCQASSWQFMCRYQFDFNKFVYEGVSFLNDEQENVLRRHITGDDVSNAVDRVTDERLLLACCSHVAEWLVSASDGDSTLVTIPDGLSDYIVLFELRQRFANVWTEVVSSNQVKVMKTTEEQRKELEAKHTSEDEKRFLNNMLGFTRIFRIMVSQKKPLVGHNALMDIMFLYDKFYRPLPASYSAFKSSIHSMFPVIYDTKHISSSVRKMYEESGWLQETNLSELYRSLNSDHGWLFATCSPVIVHADQQVRYKNNHCPHEAGYDAYMCGCVFLRLSHILASSDVKSTDAKPIAFRTLLRAAQPYVNSLNVIRGSIYAVNLDGPDEPSPCLWLYISARRKASPVSLAHLSRVLSPFGLVDIRTQGTRHAVIAVRAQKISSDILQSLRNHPELVATSYSYWRHSPTVRVAFWTGLAACGAACAAAAVWSTLRSKPS